MDAKELKEYIIKRDLLESLLHKIGCHSIIQYANEIRCALPDDNDSSKVSVFPDDNLSVRIFTKGETVYGSIYDLIMFIDKSEFPEAYKKCKALLGLSGAFTKNKNKTDHLQFFKGLKKKKPQQENELKTYDLSILDRYSSIPHIDLIKKDGIFDKQIIEKYHLKFDERTDRIVFPHFHYQDKTKVVGLIGRTTIAGYESLKIAKYLPVDGYRYEKSKNLYGLSHNINEIKQRGYCLVFEAEKSVIKADMMGYGASVSIGSHDISAFQMKMLISLGVEIIIAFDKDVLELHVKNICQELNKYTKSSYIKDNWKLLKGDKDSPVDRGLKRWKFLFKHRISV